jgi:signal transduction histidine kinase
MITNPPQEYRLIYDNLSQFTIELNKANSLTDIQLTLHNNIKYLFNCYVCRITYFQQNNFFCYTISNEMPSMVTGTSQLLWDVEKLLFYEGLPLRLNKHEHASILQNLPNKNDVNQLWGWKLNFRDDAGILLTILANEEKPFSRKHIPLAKMICEMLFGKIRLILLLQTVQKNVDYFTLTNKQLEEGTNTISELVNPQEKVIEKRILELTRLNKQLLDIIHFNSHTIREPLNRIMGIIQLKSLVSEEEFFKDCWPMLVSSVQDLDNRIRKFIEKAEKI